MLAGDGRSAVPQAPLAAPTLPAMLVVGPELPRHAVSPHRPPAAMGPAVPDSRV